MCGFAGVVAFNQQFRVSRETLESMAGCIAHRGPDGHGFHTDEHAALAHVRLAILDPDPRSDQPFHIGAKWIVFNGEIYNFRELRTELDRDHPGHAWRTTGDTEVLLRAYEVWGAACLPKLNGMFAFAVWDESDRSLFLARDRMGQKPLYYAVAPAGGAVAFGSELGALKDLPWADRTIDPASLTHYLSWGYVPAPATIYRGIRKLAHARWAKFTPDGRREEGRYYDVNATHPTGGVTEDQVRDVVRTAVRRQLVADVPVGCFLSGGIDSSIVASSMKRAVGAGQRVMTFSIGFDDPRYDETAYARDVARHLGTEHHEFRVTADAAADLPKLARVYGEPFADSSALPTHYLSRETRGSVKVALSGDGGDELFGGYERYRAMAYAERLKWVPGAMLGGVVLEQLPASHPKSVASHVRRFVKSLKLPPAERYADYIRLFSKAGAAALLPDMDQEAAEWLEREYQQVRRGRDVVEAALAVDRETYLPEDLLTKVDRASMLHALEVRSPFMDPDVLALAGRLRTDELLKGGGKRMLREAFAAELPPDVFKRRKMGFAVPIGDWFRRSLRGMLRDLVSGPGSFAAGHLNLPAVTQLVDEHERRSEDHSQRLYALLMLELWWRQQRR
jgi:asparagine synthase (glutamine-hydrolysing)